MFEVHDLHQTKTAKSGTWKEFLLIITMASDTTATDTSTRAMISNYKHYYETWTCRLLESTAHRF